MFEEADIRRIRDLIRKDIELLNAYNLMDYSLLLAVERVKNTPH